ncbi:DUF2625 family protein [Catellatospora citrea]|uniref:DUF2625 family protein n=1 Tax=Catellatospora citrea TaxID=53366 RepID=A0A8J3NYI8_9ACTN|nr:DUF2625 family protein [Catellatospora citrea]RKE09548.1 uncharacterized protein DUF2625 [Catellatospora citrea]GIF97510.1 hypothetical protein Cci01nite_26040 [Catellatospora citrea]
MRPVDELINIAEDAWSELLAELTAGAVQVRVLSTDHGPETLRMMQVTTRSRLGAMALHAGGVVLDHGWLRLYGGGHPAEGLPSLAEANGFDGGPREAPASFAVGHDVLGGRYEVNGPVPPEDRPGDPGEVCYYAPESLEWQPLDMPYGTWLSWLASGRLDDFYGDVRWPGWQDEARALRLDQGISMYPFLFTAEARQDLAATNRRPIPIDQLMSVHGSLARSLGDLPNGSSFVVRVEP